MEGTTSPFKTILNFRDVGEAVNNYTGQKLLKTGLLYRSARPDNSSLADRAKLVDDYGVKHVIDLRTTSEHKEQDTHRTRRIKGMTKTEDPSSQSKTEIQRPSQIPGLTYHLINFNGKAYSNTLVAKLSWPSYLRLASLMAIGRRNEAISIVGSQVMAPRGLTGLGLDVVDACVAEVRAVFEILAKAESYPILVHCTQGKDRTGMIILYTLLLLSVPLPAIKEDYLKSEPELEPERADRLKEILAIGLTEEFVTCPEGFVETISCKIDKDFGGIEGYLEHCGVGKDMQRKVVEILRA